MVGRNTSRTAAFGVKLRPAGPAALDGDRLLHTLIDDAPDFIEILDRSGIIRYISPAITRLGGYLPEEVIGRHFKEFVHVDDQAKALAAFDRALHTHDLVQVTTRYRHKDSSWRVVENLARNYLEDPQIGGVIVHTRDVTLHVQIERTLEETEQRYHSLVSALAKV
jgi:PAS domain S-box-containing protein